MPIPIPLEARLLTHTLPPIPFVSPPLSFFTIAVLIIILDPNHSLLFSLWHLRDPPGKYPPHGRIRTRIPYLHNTLTPRYCQPKSHLLIRPKTHTKHFSQIQIPTND